jgi:hypothetical protein
MQREGVQVTDCERFGDIVQCRTGPPKTALAIYASMKAAMPEAIESIGGTDVERSLRCMDDGSVFCAVIDKRTAQRPMR